MSVYARYKRDPEGFRKLVELLEATPMSRRAKMLELGMQEDADYTKAAQKFMLTFDDVMKMPDMEKTELIDRAPPKSVAYAVQGMTEEERKAFLKCALGTKGVQIKEFLEDKASPFDISSAKMKLITVARELERGGVIRTKAIPLKV